jgi:hypothetical protein
MGVKMDLILREELRSRVFRADGKVTLLRIHKSNGENPMAVDNNHALFSFVLHIHHTVKTRTSSTHQTIKVCL